MNLRSSNALLFFGVTLLFGAADASAKSRCPLELAENLRSERIADITIANSLYTLVVSWPYIDAQNQRRLKEVEIDCSDLNIALTRQNGIEQATIILARIIRDDLVEPLLDTRNSDGFRVENALKISSLELVPCSTFFGAAWSRQYASLETLDEAGSRLVGRVCVTYAPLRGYLSGYASNPGNIEDDPNQGPLPSYNAAESIKMFHDVMSSPPRKRWIEIEKAEKANKQNRPRELGN